jgi:acyl carrier protein
VLAPKVLGAWNLHQLTQNDPLDHFVLFSSFASVIGNPGQGNYAAANAFLDGLARWRFAKGLPALAVNWGAIGGVGHVARHQDLAARMTRGGARLLPHVQAFRILGRLLEQGDVPQMGAVDFEWDKIAAITNYVSSPVWSHLVRRPDGATEVEQTNANFQELLQSTPERQRPELLRRRLAEHVARVLGTTFDRLDAEKGLTLLGLDSLMAVELRIRIERDMNLDVPVMVLMQGPSVVELARQLTEKVTPASV